MTIIQSIIIGIVQGATEFLPISSTGHLVLIPHLFGWDIPADQAFALNVILQAATLVAVISYFFRDIYAIFSSAIMAIRNRAWKTQDIHLVLSIIIATLPAGFVGFFLNKFFERVFNSPQATAGFLIGTAFILVIGEKTGTRQRSFEEVNWRDAIWIGLSQVLALFPGISRSGSTITAGMIRNFNRPSSARFSFLISIPLMIGAGVNGLYKFIELPNTTAYLSHFLAGSITAAVVGYLSIKWLLKFLSHRSLYIFTTYCLVFAAINLILMAIQ